MTKNISATELKNKVSEVLNLVYFDKATAIIERRGKPVARIVPIKPEKAKSKKSMAEIKKILDSTYGCLPDFPDVTKKRKFELKKDKKDLEKAWKDSFGSIPDFPDVTKFRRSRRREITL